VTIQGRAASRRKLGLWMCTALVVGNMIGSGVFLLPASLGSYGAVSLVGWAFTSTGAILLAVMFAKLSRMVPRSGGPYAYTRAGVGEFAAFLVAWGYWISICAGNAAIAVGMVGYLGFFWPPLSVNPVPGAAAALGAIWLLTWVNARGVREAGGVQLVTTLLKLLPLVAVGTVGLVWLHGANFTPFNVSGRSTVSAVSATATLTLWAFLGLESATIPASEVAHADRTIPRATILGTLTAAVVYVLGTVAVMGVIPAATLARSTAPFADAAAAMWGPWAAKAVAAGAAISCFGALNGWILLQGQLPLAAATDGVLPSVFGRVSGRGTPVAGLVISSVLVTLIVATNFTRGLVDEFTFIILLATITTLVPYVFSSLALVLMSLKGQLTEPRTAVMRLVVLGILALGYSTWAIIGSGSDAILWGCALLLGGVPLYWWVGRRRFLLGGASAREADRRGPPPQGPAGVGC
jgi:basic amino acid/polyamine antiporter, APA family